MKGQEVTQPLVMQPILLILLDAEMKEDHTHRCSNTVTSPPTMSSKLMKALMFDLLQQWPGYSFVLNLNEP